ncbi:MAG: helicase-related protein [Blastocatellia bacterium]
MEFLLTTLLCLPAPPWLVLLSASIKQQTDYRNGFHLAMPFARRNAPRSYTKEIWALEEDEEANEIVAQQAHRIVANPQQSVLIFVYQTASADTLAKKLNDDWKEAAQVGRVLSYHARLSAARREEVRQAFLRGECRCIVTTTALGLGMNLPATHVILRDNTFPGVGKLSLSEILQMMGRAGRGTQEGAPQSWCAHAMAGKQRSWPTRYDENNYQKSSPFLRQSQNIKRGHLIGYAPLRIQLRRCWRESRKGG